MPMPDRVVFLFGAGISRVAGMPTTANITETILSGEGVYRHSDDLFYLAENRCRPPSFSFEPVKAIRPLLLFVKAEIDKYFSDWSEHRCNYEDLCYYVTQLCNNAEAEYENPAIAPAAQQLKAGISNSLRRIDEDQEAEFAYYDRLREADGYIRDVVSRLLEPGPKALDYLYPLVESVQAIGLQKVTLATLNHDLVLERLFDETGVKYQDGFGSIEHGLQWWKRGALDSGEGLRLLKLHGSVNWHRIGETTKRAIEDRGIGKLLRRDPWRIAGPKGKRQYRSLDGRPLLLVGTFNKILDYQLGIFVEVHHEFYRALRTSSLVIVCGYSFGDKVINLRLIEWLNEDRKRRMAILHACPDELKSGSRPAIALHLDEWRKEGRVFFIEKWIDGFDWAEILEAAGYRG